MPQDHTMRLMKSALLILMLVGQISAAGPEDLFVWTRKDLSVHKAALIPKMNEYKQAADLLGDFGNHTAWIAHREANGEMEVHTEWADLMFVQSGEATLLIGGTVINARTVSPGEIRGTTSAGGEKRLIRQGDVVQVAAGMPHQFLIAPGRQITFFTMKIAAK
jgi:mannose-6-phosphate isomerase-like protein (cupin superfamily)